MFTQIFEAFRDLIFGLLPKSFVSRFFDGEFAFICHPLDARDAIRKYPFTRGISEKLFEFWARNFWPVVGAPIIGPDKVTGESSKGWAVICPLPPSVMVKDPNFARRMILRTVRLCEKMGLKLVALGGYNSIITRDGEDLVEKTKMAVTTGNTYSALLVLENLKNVAAGLSFNLANTRVAIIGAAGSVGTACSQMIPKLVKEVWLMDTNRKSLRELVERIKERGGKVNIFDDLNRIKDFDVVVTATSTPRAIIHPEHVRTGMIFIDASQPKNISEEMARSRKDILVIDSGIGKLPRLICDMEMGPYQNEVYACLGEALALVCHNAINSFSIGKVQPEKVEELAFILKEIHFEVPQFRNAGGYIPEEMLQQFKEKYFGITLPSRDS